MDLSRVYLKVVDNSPVPIGLGTGDLAIDERWTTLISSTDPLTDVEIIVLDNISGEGEGRDRRVIEGEGIVEREGATEGVYRR
jgi:hypothetical protein